MLFRSDYQTEANFNDRSGEAQKIGQYYREQELAQLSQVKALPAILSFGLAALSAVGAAVVAPVLLGGTALFALVGGGLLLSNQRRRRLITQTCLQNAQSKQTMLEQLFAEYDQMTQQYADYDHRADEVRHTLDTF